LHLRELGKQPVRVASADAVVSANAGAADNAGASA